MGKADRAAAGSALRAVADALAGDMGIRAFELYISTAHPRSLVVEPADPPVIVMGTELVALGPAAIRFSCAYALRLIGMHVTRLACGSAHEAGLWLAGAVRQFVPDYRHPQISDAEVSAASTRVGKAIGRSMRSELAPFAAEIAIPFELDKVFAAVHEGAARVGLLACGDLAAALQVLFFIQRQPLQFERLGTVPIAGALLDFAISQEYEDLVGALDAIS